MDHFIWLRNDKQATFSQEQSFEHAQDSSRDCPRHSSLYSFCKLTLQTDKMETRYDSVPNPDIGNYLLNVSIAVNLAL